MTSEWAGSSSETMVYKDGLFGSPASAPVAREITAKDIKTMPLEPMDVMWMSKAPQVSDLVVQPDVKFKSVAGIGSGAVSPSLPIGIGADDSIRPDYDTDVLWKGPGRIHKERTVSIESTDSELGTRKFSVSEAMTGPTSPVDITPRSRRISISEMLFGSSPSSFSWGMGSSPTNNNISDGMDERKMSISDDPRFKDFLKHQSKIIGDDGVLSSGFKRSNYQKE
ncbi:unnamed protein product [Caenorhabditis bovis]|uniref:Uncharacterized protein n=1 Tax=Caenorhabditis bovis TaxID=2654633 RepID=A0A8S1F1J6_9PELO|nr:unnamed protein product [Caenorhabditis bovis]